MWYTTTSVVLTALLCSPVAEGTILDRIGKHIDTSALPKLEPIELDTLTAVQKAFARRANKVDGNLKHKIVKRREEAAAEPHSQAQLRSNKRLADDSADKRKSKVHKCIHDEMAPKQHIQTHWVDYEPRQKPSAADNAERRRLAEDSFAPIRITPFWDYIENSGETAANLKFMKEIVSASLRYFEKYLLVRPVLGPLYAPRACASGYSVGDYFNCVSWFPSLSQRCIDTKTSGSVQSGECLELTCQSFNADSGLWAAVSIDSGSESHVCAAADMGTEVWMSTLSKYIKCPDVEVVCGGVKPFACAYGHWHAASGQCLCDVGFSDATCESEDRTLKQGTEAGIALDDLSDLCVFHSANENITGVYTKGADFQQFATYSKGGYHVWFDTWYHFWRITAAVGSTTASYAFCDAGEYVPDISWCDGQWNTGSSMLSHSCAEGDGDDDDSGGNGGSSDSLSAGAIIGIVFAVMLVGAILAAFGVKYYESLRKPEKKTVAKSMQLGMSEGRPEATHTVAVTGLTVVAPRPLRPPPPPPR